MKKVILSADDFGLSEAVNEGVEQAHRHGLLTSASLMVAGAAVADAVRRARAMPELSVGLHLVVIEGRAVLPPEEIPLLVEATQPGIGWFPSDQLRLGIDYFFRPAVRRQLSAEIRAQFAAFRSTGLTLGHADAHKHMHLHPTIGRMMINIGREFGLRALRVPREPQAVMTKAGIAANFGGRALEGWTGVLRAQARRAGLHMSDAVFGLAWTGHMTEQRLLRLAPLLPEGVSEIYFHPASRRDPTLDALMPNDEHQAELDCLQSPRLRSALQDFELTTYQRLSETAP